METRLVPAAGFPLELITVGALESRRLAHALKTLFDLPRAIAQSAQLIRNFRPDVDDRRRRLCLRTSDASRRLCSHVPLMAFEPNVVPGFANRLVAPHGEGGGRALRGHAEVLSATRL